MCICDLDPPRFYREDIRKARKQHKCCECETVINPGDTYADIFGVWDDADSFKQCQKCNELGSKLSQDNKCGYPLGQLNQELIDSDYLAKDENTKQWFSQVAWIQAVQQKPLKCILVNESAIANNQLIENNAG